MHDAPSARAVDATVRPSPRGGEAVLREDMRRSMRNALKLGLSLCGTWAVALGVRIYLPRHLGPQAFGAYQFADSFTTVAFVVTSLGLDTYIRKEVAVRREHASDFFAGTTLVRLLLGVMVLLVSVFGLDAAGKPAQVVTLVAVLGVAQLLQNGNATFAALLHAVGAVDGLSVLNVVCKLGWGAGIALALFVGGGDVRWVGVAVLASETLRTVGMATLARRHLSLRWAVDLSRTREVLRASAPFFVGGVATTVYGGLDTSIMSFLTHDVEVGWYGATSTLVGLALILSPLIGWVLIPMMSRSAARSTDELLMVGRRGMQFVLTLAFPITLLLGLHAELAIQTVFGDAYAPAAGSLRIEAPLFVLTYGAMVVSTVLVRLERGWTVTAVVLGGLLLSPPLNVVLVPWGLERFGPGGAGIGAALTLMITEAVTTAALFWQLGRGAFDRELVVMLGKTLAVCVAVTGVHLLLKSVGPVSTAAGPWAAWARLGIDATLYTALVLATGAVDLAAARDLVAAGRSSRLAGGVA